MAPPFGDILPPAYYDGGDSSVIRFDFVSAISAFGLDFISNNVDTTLSFFDSSNTLIESRTITTDNMEFCFIGTCGYVGIDVGANLISYATIDTPLDGDELWIDNIIYQMAEVPEPSTLVIFALGIMGLASRRFKKQ